MNFGGYAADTIGKMLTKRGAVLATEPAGFIVTGEEGPLQEGEIDRAKSWARALLG